MEKEKKMEEGEREEREKGKRGRRRRREREGGRKIRGDQWNLTGMRGELRGP